MKGPFFVQSEFLSPLLCEQIIQNDFNDSDSKVVVQRLKGLISLIESRYNVTVKDASIPELEFFGEGNKGEEFHCENSIFVRQKWLRNTSRDLTAIVFLSDYQDQVPFDNDFEVYGGMLEFPQHRSYNDRMMLRFEPQRGTLLIFPSDPHFINKTTPVKIGDLYRLKFHITTSEPFLYDPSKFPGTYEDWLKEFL